MAADRAVEVQSASSVGTSGTTFTFEGGIQSLIMTTSADCYVNFDQPVGASDNAGFLVKGGVTNNQWDFHGGNTKQVNVRAVTGTAAVYILGVRN